MKSSSPLLFKGGPPSRVHEATFKKGGNGSINFYTPLKKGGPPLSMGRLKGGPSFKGGFRFVKHTLAIYFNQFHLDLNFFKFLK